MCSPNPCDSRPVARVLAAAFLLVGPVVLVRARGQSPSAPTSETVDIDGDAASHPFPHFWEQVFGSGRAILSLRQGYRDDLRGVKQITDFQCVRFHAILDDDVGLYNEARDGGIDLNFSCVDQIYDGLLANGVRPFVELSFAQLEC